MKILITVLSKGSSEWELVKTSSLIISSKSSSRRILAKIIAEKNVICMQKFMIKESAANKHI